MNKCRYNWSTGQPFLYAFSHETRQTTTTILQCPDHNMFQHIKVCEFCPGFAAEVTGIDFSRPVDDEACDEIKQAVHQVSWESIVCRKRTSH